MTADAISGSGSALGSIQAYASEVVVVIEVAGCPTQGLFFLSFLLISRGS
jgi:hypothetical protein